MPINQNLQAQDASSDHTSNYTSASEVGNVLSAMESRILRLERQVIRQREFIVDELNEATGRIKMIKGDIKQMQELLRRMCVTG